MANRKKGCLVLTKRTVLKYLKSMEDKEHIAMIIEGEWDEDHKMFFEGEIMQEGGMNKMPQCTIEIPKKIDVKIKHYMVDNDIKNKAEAIIKILEELK